MWCAFGREALSAAERAVGKRELCQQNRVSLPDRPEIPPDRACQIDLALLL